MKKKMIAAIIACSMAMTTMPSAAFANEVDVTTDTGEVPAAEMQEADPETEETQEPDVFPEEETVPETMTEAEGKASESETEAASEPNAEVQVSGNYAEKKGVRMMAMSTSAGTSKFSATPISMEAGSSVTGTFANNKVEYWYKFTLNNSRRIKLHFDYEWNNSCYAYIYTAANTNYEIFCTSGGNNRITYLGKGTYYLRLCPSPFTNRSTRYSFDVLSNQYVKDEIAEPNDSILGAVSLKRDRKYSGALVKADANLNADSDYVRYNVAKGTYKLNVKVPEALTYGGSGGTPAGSIEIYAMDANGNSREIFYVNGYNKRYVNLKSGTRGSFTVNMPKGETYLQVVYGGIDKVVGQYSIELVKLPGRTSSLKLKTAGKRTLKVTCKAVSYKTGYEVKYKKKGSRKWTTKRFAKNTFTLKKLKKKTTYVVKVRAYRKVNGKTYYSGWTAAKVKRTK